MVEFYRCRCLFPSLVAAQFYPPRLGCVFTTKDLFEFYPPDTFFRVHFLGARTMHVVKRGLVLNQCPPTRGVRCWARSGICLFVR